MRLRIAFQRESSGVLIRSAVGQRQNSRPFRTVIERMKPPDFIQATHTIQTVEITRVARCELAGLEIATAEICVAKCVWALPREKLEVQPAPVSLRDTLGFSEKSDKK